MKLKRAGGIKYSIGFDLSLTGTGVVVLNKNDKLEYSNTLKNKVRGEERLSLIRDELDALLSIFPQALVCVEGYAMGIRTGQSFSIGELGGVIKLMLWEQKIPFHIVSPTSLKKYVLGKGVGDKDMVIMNVYKRWGFEADTSDEADAYVLAKIASSISFPIEDLPKYQAEVIDVVLNPPAKTKKGKKK